MSANREALVRVARTLEPMLDELVFVGGRVVEFYITDPMFERPRPTADSDVVCRLARYGDVAAFERRLEDLGLRHDTSAGAPIWRWCSETDTIDVMPDDPNVFGFESRWHRYGVDTAQRYLLADDLEIRIFTPTVFVSDKLDAYGGRGGDDLRASQDVEDVIRIFGGRPQIVDEFESETDELRAWVSERLAALFGGPFGAEIIESHLWGPDRRSLVSQVAQRLETASRGGRRRD